jgi:hypothetical protein
MPNETSWRQRFSDIGSAIYDVCTFRPEGPGGQFASKGRGKDGVSVLLALFAFVATGGGALALTDKLSISKWVAITSYCIVSLIAICVVVRLLRLRDPQNANQYYYDQGTIVLGLYVLIISVVTFILFAICYGVGLFSPTKPPYKPSLIEMSKAVALSGDAASAKFFARDFSNQDDERTLQHLSFILTTGLHRKTGRVYGTFSPPFEKQYADFRLQLFPESDPLNTLIFVYTTYPTTFGHVQADFRPLYFDIGKQDTFLRTFMVRSPTPGDRLLVLFWSEQDPTSKKLILINETTF